MRGAGLHPQLGTSAPRVSRCLQNGLVSCLTCLCKEPNPHPEEAVEPAPVAAWHRDSIGVCQGPTALAG